MAVTFSARRARRPASAISDGSTMAGGDMNQQALRSGALGGMLGGAMMAMWSMIVLWLTGVGFWTPLNLIAHTLWRGAPLGATFSWGGLLLGWSCT
jgi:predicted lipid-binding transport protein (Tim44 family)